MSAAHDDGPDADARELAALSHAVARSARRAWALGQRVHAPRTPAPELAKSAGLAPNAGRASSTGQAASAERNPNAEPNSKPARTADTARASSPERTPIAASARTPATPPDRRVPSVPERETASVAEIPTMARPKSASPAASALDVKRQARAAQNLGELRACVAACQACGLHKTRTQTVFMDGTGARGVAFVGEAPGADEDRTGVPFVGRSGQLLTDIITKGMGLARAEVAIVNVLKCRPPDNREPTNAEKEICTPWLDRQIELLDPKVIIPLGRHAAMHVLRVESPMGEMRQRVYDQGGRKIVPTFHPSFLLRSPGQKKECWKDIQLAMGILGLPTQKSADEAR